MADKQSMTPEEAAELRADFKTAMFAGGGLALSIIGLFLIPIASAAGLIISFFGFKTCRPEYRVGKITSIIGMAAGLVGVASLILAVLAAS